MAKKEGETKVAKNKKDTASKPAGSMFIFEQPVTAVIRWMGKDQFSFAEAKAALRAGKGSKMPADGTIKTQLQAGKNGLRGDPAKLTQEHIKILRDAAKEESKKEEKD